MPEHHTALCIVGARPNFVKLAALYRAFQGFSHFRFRVVHTGQHYDPQLSDAFFRELELPGPDHHLGIGAVPAAEQLGLMLTALAPVLEAERPRLVLVVGDTTSTLAGALAANRAGIPVAHVEAGLRSGDRGMPEEINRILTDAVSDYLFVTEAAGLKNLEREGVAPERVFFAGNTMIDTLIHCRDRAAATQAAQALGLTRSDYVLATLHRPSNVDTPEGWQRLVELLQECSRQAPVVFPVHPRTRLHLDRLGLGDLLATQPNLLMIPPQPYLGFLDLLENAAAVVTDSGGVQEESTFVGVPCITYRSTTERPVTVRFGTNVLADDLLPETVGALLEKALCGQWKSGITPPLWDGEAALRIADVLVTEMERSTGDLSRRT
jgi:UDP-N-acetylglucosamine 2-epimerase (non-hydrolysing)